MLPDTPLPTVAVTALAYVPGVQPAVKLPLASMLPAEERALEVKVAPEMGSPSELRARAVKMEEPPAVSERLAGWTCTLATELSV